MGKALMLGSYVLTLNSSMSFLTLCTCAAAEPEDGLNVESEDNEGNGCFASPTPSMRVGHFFFA